VIWVRGPHLASANGVLLAGRRLLTSRQALFTYPDAESARAEAPITSVSRLSGTKFLVQGRHFV